MKPHENIPTEENRTPCDADSTAQTLRDIKRSLRGMMNGITSRSMRDKGLGYKVNFGVELPRLLEFAATLPHDYALAARLWKEDIRECRLLAAMLMPAETYTAELADLWVEQMRYNEEAECTVMYLFARLSCASAKAFEWVAREEKMFRLCGWLLMGRLLAGGAVPSERDEEELLDQLAAELGGNDTAVARAAAKALGRYMELGETQERRGEELLQRLA